jgi:hypothetical protein
MRSTILLIGALTPLMLGAVWYVAVRGRRAPRPAAASEPPKRFFIRYYEPPRSAAGTTPTNETGAARPIALAPPGRGA